MRERRLEAGEPEPERALPTATIGFMAVSVGVIVANIYYAQPLLADIARTFHLSVTAAGGVAMLSQAGAALGMLLFVPLGDTHEKRALITFLLLGSTISLVLFATAASVLWLGLAGLLVGATGAAVHVFVPFAAHLASPRQRGRVVGSVLSGLLFGVLLARTFSGLLGALFFCAFSAFWTTLVFLLETPPYHYGSQAAGRSLAGLVVGVILLDLGVQSGHVANQTRIYGLDPEARSRLNTFYMVSYFLGGGAGSLLGAYSWRLAGWPGVCGFALLEITLALVYFGVSSRRLTGAPREI